MGGVEPVFFGKVGEDFGGKLGLGMAEAEEFEEVVDASVCGEGWWCGHSP